MSSFIIYSFLLMTVIVQRLVCAAGPKAPKVAAKEDAPKDEDTKKDDAPKDDAPKDDAPKDDAPKDDAPKDDGAAKDGDAKADDKAAKEGDAKKDGDAAKDGDAPKEEEPKKEGDAAKEGDAKKEGDATKDGDAHKEGDAGGDGNKNELTNANAAEETMVCVKTSSAYILENLVTGATPTGDTMLNCPPQFIQLADGCYHFGGNYLFSTNYADAKKHCKDLKGDLVHIENKHEFEAIYHYIEHLPSTIAYKEITQDYYYYWTGGKWDGKKWMWGNKKVVQGYWCDMGHIVYGNLKVLTLTNAEYGGCYKSENEQIMSGNYVCEAPPIKK